MPPVPWRARVEPVLRPLVFAGFRLRRGMTLGVRGIAIDPAGRVCLVRQGYTAGWWLPGGGVERGQTAEQALVQEMREEAGLTLTAPPTLLSIHANEAHFRGDHVLLYRLNGFQLGRRTAGPGEIADVQWFAPDALPDDLSPGSRRRLDEALNGAPVSPWW